IPPIRKAAPAVAEPMPGNPLVMIDPGHGGYDPGTQSSSGILEKDLALNIAQRVAYALKARGVRAQLTRNTDEFIPLSERTRRANVADADLFVSIHLNSSPNPETTGIEVYYLNNTTDRATIRLARMENAGVTGTSAPIDGNLNYILADLRQNYKATEAASLARSIDTQTVNDLDAQLGLEVNPLGAKMGPFYVLVGAHMPAVLVECGFLSNPTEAQRLAAASYQDVLAEGIATAVARYLTSEAAMGNL
ncbi:MAG TPA: N-acetylmuramoyl-L-alanine amidase, partial [Candidatus Binataceae bacterium]|nr:N-acetylmuramoyl-L-alanine amidase [Candidatus Binataceae bacterium]